MSLALALPSTSLASTRPVSTVVVSPLPLASILDHHLRRNSDQDRVLGTLLGVRREASNEIEVRSAFGVPYQAQGKGEVTVDMDHHKALLDLHQKVHPREVVVGWYATHSQLNSFSALIHNFYSSESSPFPAVHLTLDPESLVFQAFTASPIGITPRADQLAFVPVRTEMRVNELERPGLDLLTSNLTSLQTSATTVSVGENIPLSSPLSTLLTLLTKVSLMLDAVLSYVRQVNAGSIKGDERVGRALLETVGVVPAATSSPSSKNLIAATSGGSTSFEDEFNTHLADVLMVSYLANLVQTQSEISSRLNLLV